MNPLFWLGLLLGMVALGAVLAVLAFTVLPRLMLPERRSVLGRRVSNYATWLTLVCLNFELVLYWSLGRVTTLFLPAKANEGQSFFDAFFAGKEPGMVNAVLDRLARDLRPAEVRSGEARGAGPTEA